MKYILVFGSLRQNSKRGYNFNRFGGQTYIKDFELPCFKMYDLKYYPAICLTDDKNDKIKCELHSIEDEAFKCVQRMEAGAGYKELKISDGNKECSIFCMDKDQLKDYPEVKNGDWD